MNNNLNNQVLEYGVCGIREIQLVKNEHLIEHSHDGHYVSDCDLVTSYEVQIRIPYCIFGINGLLLLIGEFLKH